MIDSKQDEAVKLATVADELLAAQPDPGYSEGCLRYTHGQAQRAVIAALTRTTPANLNDPDKQEADVER